MRGHRRIKQHSTRGCRLQGALVPETRFSCFGLGSFLASKTKAAKGIVGRSQRKSRKSCCKRKKIKPNRNRSLIHKRKNHLRPEMPNMEKSRSVHNYSITRVSYPRPSINVTPNGICLGFSSKDIISHWILDAFMQNTYFNSLKIFFCLSHFSFSPQDCNGQTLPTWWVPQAAGVPGLWWQLCQCWSCPASASQPITCRCQSICCWSRQQMLKWPQPATPSGISVSTTEGEGAEQCKKIPLPWIFMWIFKHAWCVFARPLCPLLVECTSKWVSEENRRKCAL